jgi:nitrite reductase/ring-hydroxylating ferredoxin subunit
MAREICVCDLNAIPENGMLQYELDGSSVLICRDGEKLHAVDGICPHRGAQLATGTLEGNVVVCPWHDWAFDVESGCGLTNPTSNLRKFDVWVRDGQVFVSLPDE